MNAPSISNYSIIFRFFKFILDFESNIESNSSAIRTPPISPKAFNLVVLTAIREESQRILRGNAEHVQKHGQPLHGHIRLFRIRQTKVHDRGVLRRHKKI